MRSTVPTRQYCAGWIDSSIHDFLADIETPPNSMKYALITCLDSCHTVGSILDESTALRSLRRRAVVVGGGFLVSTKRLLSAERTDRIFYGFDEIWFFPRPNVEPNPKQVCLTGPTELAGALPTRLVQWMERSRCSLGLGDGTGLNFVAKLSGVARYLISEWNASLASSGAG
jgi:hypothetical protein